MTIKTFQVNPLGVNCYVVSDEGEAAIIDCGCFEEREWKSIMAYIEQEGLTVKLILLTHAHFDHVYGLRFVERDLNMQPMLHSLDVYQYEHSLDMLVQFMGVRLPGKLPTIGQLLKDGDELTLGSKTISVIHTPGHTPGGVCYYFEKDGILFSGDTLFMGSVGRADFPGGDMQTEIDSVRERLMTLPDSVRVLPGHGPGTTIEYERENNMYVGY